MVSEVKNIGIPKDLMKDVVIRTLHRCSDKRL